MGLSSSIEAQDQPAPKLGILRLDYNYTPIPGDIDCSASFGYDVVYRAVPGLTFEICQAGKLTGDVRAEMVQAIRWLDDMEVSAMTGDCGFMLYFQRLVRQHTAKPVFLSSLVQLSAVATAFAASEQVAILTANEANMEALYDNIKQEYNVDARDDRFLIVGCEDVPGFDAVAEGKPVDPDAVGPGMVHKALTVVRDNPRVRAFVSECTELPHYSNAVRAVTGLPVFDAMTCSDFAMAGFMCNPRFGFEGWQNSWDGRQSSYSLGQNLNSDERKELINGTTPKETPPTPGGPLPSFCSSPLLCCCSKSRHGERPVIQWAPSVQSQGSPTLGIVRLDYAYPPIPGDIDCKETFEYKVLYRCVPGLTFEMCQSGKMTAPVEREFVEAIKWLDNQGACGITGDCGFMMYFQPLARKHTKKPVFMSSLMQLQAVTHSFAVTERIAIFTANSETLTPMYGAIRQEVGVEARADRFIVVGCESVSGFEAVAEGKKVDPSIVGPGIMAKALQVMEDHPDLRAMVFECTELPHYSNAVRAATGLPVFDAVTCADLFMAGFLCNPRFGFKGWQQSFDGKQANYSLGDNLSNKDRAKLVNAPIDDIEES